MFVVLIKMEWSVRTNSNNGIVSHSGPVLAPLEPGCIIQQRDVHGKMEGGVRLRSISYRAMSPIYAGEPYRITSSVLEEGREPRFEVLVKKGDVVCMRGEITAEKAETSR